MLCAHTWAGLSAWRIGRSPASRGRAIPWGAAAG